MSPGSNSSAAADAASDAARSGAPFRALPPRGGAAAGDPHAAAATTTRQEAEKSEQGILEGQGRRSLRQVPYFYDVVR